MWTSAALHGAGAKVQKNRNASLSSFGAKQNLLRRVAVEITKKIRNGMGCRGIIDHNWFWEATFEGGF